MFCRGIILTIFKTNDALPYMNMHNCAVGVGEEMGCLTDI